MVNARVALMPMSQSLSARHSAADLFDKLAKRHCAWFYFIHTGFINMAAQA